MMTIDQIKAFKKLTRNVVLLELANTCLALYSQLKNLSCDCCGSKMLSEEKSPKAKGA